MRSERAVRKDMQLVSSVRIVCWGVAIGAVVTVVLLLLLSYAFVIMKNIPHRAITPLGIALSAVGAFSADILPAGFPNRRDCCLELLRHWLYLRYCSCLG